MEGDTAHPGGAAFGGRGGTGARIRSRRLYRGTVQRSGNIEVCIDGWGAQRVVQDHGVVSSGRGGSRKDGAVDQDALFVAARSDVYRFGRAGGGAEQRYFG